jgi:hypothetical protein
VKGESMAEVSKENGRKFLAEVEKLCRKYNISISHEDQHGAFLLEEFSELNMSWLKEASYGSYE